MNKSLPLTLLLVGATTIVYSGDQNNQNKMNAPICELLSNKHVVDKPQEFYECLKLLIASGESVNEPINDYNQTLLMNSLQFGATYTETTKLLLENSDPTATDVNGNTLVQYACKYGCSEMIKAVLEKQKKKNTLND
jgi:ankyrin repeat protein